MRPTEPELEYIGFYMEWLMAEVTARAVALYKGTGSMRALGEACEWWLLCSNEVHALRKAEAERE